MFADEGVNKLIKDLDKRKAAAKKRNKAGDFPLYDGERARASHGRSAIRQSRRTLLPYPAHHKPPR